MDWRHRASCRDEDPELFYPMGNGGPALLQIVEAKSVCRRCPVVSACLEYALEFGQDAGVWGNTSEDERRALKRRNARTRAKATQPEVVEEPAGPLPTAAEGVLYDRNARWHALRGDGKLACHTTMRWTMQRAASGVPSASWCRVPACQQEFARVTAAPVLMAEAVNNTTGE
jgi:WhiB family redox-sensing transcriptional regulator